MTGVQKCALPICVIPNGITVGKNTCIFGKTDDSDYPEKFLASGKTLIKEGDNK